MHNPTLRCVLCVKNMLAWHIRRTPYWFLWAGWWTHWGEYGSSHLGHVNKLGDWRSHQWFLKFVYSVCWLYIQIMAFMTDNASNNNTLIQQIVSLAKQKGIYLNVKWIRLCCMSHTVHLAVLKVSYLILLQLAHDIKFYMHSFLRV